VPWTIDNKYYTAQVNIQLLELDDDGAIPTGVEVLIYLFDEVCPANNIGYERDGLKIRSSEDCHML